MSKGLAGVKTLTANEIAKKWNLPLATVAKKIAAGVKVEKEHTTSTRQANEIARDHLGERPDYYEKLHKMEKTKVVKEESTTVGIAGLGLTTGTPAIDSDNQYTDTNSMSYDDWNGAILKMIKDRHNKHLIDMGFTSYSPNDLQTASNKVVKESTLNELGEYDNKGGSPGYEGISGPIRAIRKNEMAENDLKGACWKGYTAKGLKKKGNRMVPNCVPVKEQSPINERGKVPADMSGGAERGIYQEGHIGFGLPYDWAGDRTKRKVYGTKPKPKPESNEPGTGDTYDNSKQGGKVKFAKKVKEELDMATIAKRREQADSTKTKDVFDRMRSGTPKGVTDLSSTNNQQVNEISAELVGKVHNRYLEKGKAPPDFVRKAVKKKWLESKVGKKPESKKVTKEETKMDTKERINEALDNILEDNLSEMKDNLMLALQEKAMEKLEERKKIIASEYFAQ